MTDATEANRRNWRAVERWSRSTRMNDLEAVMWRAERHPGLSSTIIALEILASVPDWDRLYGAHEWGSRLVPRFRQRVVEPVVAVGPPAWEPDPAFDLDYHLRRIALPPPGTHAQMLEAVQALAMSPLDRTRPLWEAVLIEGLEGGRAAYVLKSHHSLSDGIAGIQLLNGLHSRTDAPSSAKPEPEGDLSRPTDGVELAVEEAVELARSLPGMAGRLLSPVAGLVRDPRGTAAAAQRYAGSLRRVSSAPGTPSDLLRPRSGRTWRLRTLEVGLAELKAAGRSVGGSVNDAYLAGLLGGLARYHDHFGADAGDLPVAVPVSIRRPGDPEGGNRFTAVQIAGPAHLRDPSERMAAIRAQILAARAEPALDLAGAAAPVLSRLPSELSILLRGRMGAQADLSASNFPGIAEEVYSAGARVERLFAFGPLPGSAVMATLVSHLGCCCISLNCDGEAIRDPDLLVTSMEAAFGEVAAVGGR